MDDVDNLIAQWKAAQEIDRPFIAALIELFLLRSGIFRDGEFKEAMRVACRSYVMDAPDIERCFERLDEIADEMDDAMYENAWESHDLFFQVFKAGMAAATEKMITMWDIGRAAVAERDAIRAQNDPSSLVAAEKKVAVILDQMEAFLPGHDEISQLNFFLREIDLVQREFLNGFDTAPVAPPLTEAQRQVADLTADGLTQTEISQKLWIKVATVKVHKRDIKRALGIEAGTGRKLRTELRVMGFGKRRILSTPSSTPSPTS